MFHALLFTLLCGMFVLFAIGAGGAGQPVIAAPAALLALWLGDAAFRSGRSAVRRRRTDRTSTDRRQ